MKPAALLSSAYLPPVEWMSKLVAYPTVYIEQYDHYCKQTYRNRCLIATQAGTQALTIPVSLPGAKTYMRDVRISDHGNWRHLHWQSLVSAYENSPFFEFYADDFRPFFEKKYDFLQDFNLELTQTVCNLLGIGFAPVLTAGYADAAALGADDFRSVINPKHPGEDPGFAAAEYYQVFAQRNGFKPNLSVADLLFNEGPEGIITLRNSIAAPTAGPQICGQHTAPHP